MKSEEGYPKNCRMASVGMSLKACPAKELQSVSFYKRNDRLLNHNRFSRRFLLYGYFGIELIS